MDEELLNYFYIFCKFLCLKCHINVSFKLIILLSYLLVEPAVSQLLHATEIKRGNAPLQRFAVG